MIRVALLLLLAPQETRVTPRPPGGEAELRAWLENMVVYHRFSAEEVSAATGLSKDEVEAAVERNGYAPGRRPARPKDAPLLVLPYPGGRHPRIGFLEGAVDPQRETKVSVFTPWDPESYVVVDAPEAIFSNLGLTYLAHTHVPTVWTKQGVALPPLEWTRRADGSFHHERRLPNGIAFGVEVAPGRDAVTWEMWLTNGSAEPLTGLRVQNCVMLKAARGFEMQTKENKVLEKGYAACRSDDGRRWILAAWEPFHRAWANPPCPCMHSDPKFPDCPPGATRTLRGRLSFYEGDDLAGEIARIEATGWRALPRRGRLKGEVVDDATGRPIPSRVYVRGADGSWHFASSVGSAVAYRKRAGVNPACEEMHTTLSAHPFEATLPVGKYAVTVERGKEYRPFTADVEVGEAGAELRVPLRRWIDMAARGWYSGDTHVHRSIEDLPNIMLAEDLNVAFPYPYWVLDAFQAPKRPAKEPAAEPIRVDDTHVIWPRNTEYEIFRVGGKSHTLGAFFVIGQKAPFEIGVPPVKPVLDQVRREGALLELDKHNWPWSMALVPLMNVDLYELSNNHMWRTEFGYRQFGEKAADWMKVEADAKGFTERGWIDFGFMNYYALLDCGFRLRPTAGSASGVHPVPLAFGRVYVHLPDGFSYEKWIDGLNRGRSFVTTGPMLFVGIDASGQVKGIVDAEHAVEKVEVVVNGEVVETLKSKEFETKVKVDGTSWIAVRCTEARPDGRPRFAHTAPFWIDVEGKPLRPRREEVEYLIRRVEEQIERSGAVLPEAAVEEYREALKAYRKIAETAR
jgi:hypothetical protein